MDSLRYWATDMHVDGFRFDLAPTLARAQDGDSGRAARFSTRCARTRPCRGASSSPNRGIWARTAISSAIFRRAGPNGTAVSRHACGASGRAIPASSPTWPRASPARPTSSAIAAGGPGRASISSLPMTASRLQDLVSYNDKHNEANGERQPRRRRRQFQLELRDRGANGRSDVIALRDRQKRNMLATLLLSLGVPMLLAGDEFGARQHGNNNAYCQDNEISWIDWDDIRPRGRGAGAFVRYLIHLRRRHRVFSRPRFLPRRSTVSTPGSRTSPGSRRTARGKRRGLEQSGRAVARLCAGRRRRRILYGRRPARHRRELPRHDERLSRRSRFPLPEAWRRRWHGSRWSTRRCPTASPRTDGASSTATCSRSRAGRSRSSSTVRCEKPEPATVGRDRGGRAGATGARRSRNARGS